MTDRPRPQGRREILDLLQRHGRTPRKALGQHFLADPNIVERIVRVADLDLDDAVVEIGAGTGTLTRALAAVCRSVIAYEVDEGMRNVLDETVGDLANVEVRFADATAADLETDLGGGHWTLVANLPYNVGTPLVLDLLRSAPSIVRFVVMVQREVADRLVAGPGSRTYGLPSVTARLYADVAKAFHVPPQVFVPAPDVESAVVDLRRRTPSPFAERAERLAQAAFSQRRKMLRRSLATVVTDPEAALIAAGIDPTARAEQLSVDDYLELARAVAGSTEREDRQR